MAKFCVHCGRPLQEGEICSCQNQVSQQQSEPPYSAPSSVMPIQSSPVAPGTAEIYIKQLSAFIRKSFRAPSSMLKSFAASGDRKIALGLIGIRAIMFALFMLVLCTRITDTITSMFDKIYSGMSSNRQLQEYLSFPLAKVFFLSLILSFGVACLFAVLLLFFNKYVFKADTTYDRMLCVSGGSGIAAVPFLLAGIILMFLSLNLGLCIAFFGIILELLFAFAALPGASQIDANKSVYVNFISFAVLLVAVLFIIKLVYPLYLPEQLVNGIKQLVSSSSSFSNLLNLFF